MKIIIAGMGKVGQTLAQTLIKENHEITIIDIKETNVDKMVDTLDCMGIVGNSAVQDILLEAGVETCDVLIACTNQDEVNMLTCLLAHKYSKCKTIARIREPEYYEQIKYLQEEMNITFVINPEKACANEMARNMRHFSTLSSESFIGGRIKLQKIAIEEGNVLINEKIKNLNQKIGKGVLFSIIEREDEVIIPKGDDVILEGDKISFFANELDTINFFKNIGYEYKSIKSIMIIGYSMIARYFIEAMLDFDSKCEIKIIEQDKEKCDEIYEEFPEVSVIKGNGIDTELLLQEGIEEKEAFIALTGIDEENIILSLNAQKITKAKLLTKINNLTLIENLKDLTIGTIVNPEITAANIIALMVRRMEGREGSSIESLYKLCEDKVEALQFLVKNEEKLIGKQFKNMQFKKNILIACIYRNGKIIIPKGNDELKVRDRVIIVTKDNIINDLVEILKDE